MLGLILIQTVCKGYHLTTKIAISRERANTSGLQSRTEQKNKFPISQPKHNVVGIQKNCLKETVIFST